MSFYKVVYNLINKLKLKFNKLVIWKYKKKDPIYLEIFENRSYIHKLYNKYVHQTKFEKILESLVFLAILFTATNLFLEVFLGIQNKFTYYMHIFSVWVFFIFILELFREYTVSKSNKEFFKKHGIDFVIITFLSSYFLFAGYFAFARFNPFEGLNGIIKELKNYKVTLKLFRR